MNPGPYLNGYLPVSRASDALRNQADTMLSELHGSIDRAKAFREKLAARASDKLPRVVPFHQVWGAGDAAEAIAQKTWEAAHLGPQRWVRPIGAVENRTLSQAASDPLWFSR